MEKIDPKYLDQIKADKERGIRLGWDASMSAWRVVAMQSLIKACLTITEFTADDVRPDIEASGVVTHDNRAMGGLFTTGKRLKWIEPIGQRPSRKAHGGPMTIWRSLIFQPLSRREEIANEFDRQSKLF